MNSVDERIVEMRFENGQFENGIKTSLNSLENLKKGLNLDKSTKSLSDLEKVGKKFSLSGAVDSVELLSERFSTLGIVGMSTINRLTNSAINMGKKMVNAVTQPLIQGGINRAKNIEQAKFQLEGLGVAWEKVSEDIDYAVKGTAYGLDVAAKAASQLSASNVECGDSMKAALRGISGVAAMTNSSYEDISRIFTQVAGQGRLMTNDLNQIAGRGLNVAAELAKQLGVTEAQVREMTSKGKIDFQTFAKAMDDAFGQHAKDANKTFSGALANMKAALSRIGADIATPGLQNLRDIFNSLRVVIDDIHVRLKPVIDGINKLQTSASKFVVKALSSKWDQLTQRLTEAGIATDGFKNALIETAKAHGINIDKMIADEGSFENTLKNGWLSKDITSEAFRRMVEGAGEVTESTQSMTKSLEEYQNIVRQVIHGDFDNGVARIDKLTKAGWDYATVQSFVNDVLRGGTIDISNLSDAQLQSTGYTNEQITAIRELAEEAEKAGTPLNELLSSLEKPAGKDLLIDTFQNAIKAIINPIKAIKKAWTEIFSGGKSNLVYSLIDGLHTLSAHLVMSEENVDRLTRTFKGLFSLIKLISTFAGGALRIGFNLLNAILGAFNLNILEVTARIGDAIVTIQKWVSEHNYLGIAIEKVAGIIVRAINHVRDWTKSFAELPWVKTVINSLTFDNFINGIKIAIQYIKDFAGWFKQLPGISQLLSNIKFDGVIEGAIKSAKAIVEWAKSFNSIEKIQNVLKGIKNIAGDVFKNSIESIKKLIDYLKNVDKLSLKEIIKFISEFGKGLYLDFSELATRIRDGIIKAFRWAVNNINYRSITSNIKSVFDKIISSIKSNAFILKTVVQPITGIFNTVSRLISSITKEDLIGAGKIAGLILLGNTIKQLCNLIAMSPIKGATNALNGIAGLFKSFSKSLETRAKADSFYTIAKAIAVLAASIAVLAMIEPKKLWNAAAVVGALAAGLIAVAGALTLFNKITTVNLAGVGIGILSFAASLLLIIYALNKLSKLEITPRAIDNLVAIIAALAALMLTTRLAGKNATGAGISLLAISIAMSYMVGVLQKLSKVHIDSNTVLNLSVVIGAISALMLATRLAGANAKGAGVSMLAIAGALFVMTELIDSLNTVTITSGAVYKLLGIVTILSALMLATRLAGKNAKNAGTGMLKIAVAISILAGIMYIISKMDTDGLTRGLAAVSVLGAIFAGLLVATKFAGKNQGAIISLTVAIGILAAAIAVLSNLDASGLKNATIALSSLMGVFALMMASTKFAKNAITSVIPMLVVVGILATVLAAIANLDSTSVIMASASLSTALLAMSASLLILSKVGSISIESLGALAGITLIMYGIAGIFTMLNTLNTKPSLEAAMSLSVVLLALSVALIPLSLIGAASSGVYSGLGALAALIGVVGGILAALGAIVKYVPHAQEMLDAGLPVLEEIGYALGSFFGKMTAGLTSGLPQIGENLSDFVENIASAFDKVSGINSDGIHNLGEIAKVLGTFVMIKGLNRLASMFGGIQSLFNKSSTLTGFADELIELAPKIRKIGDLSKDVNLEDVENITKVVSSISKAASEIPNEGGMFASIVGDNGIAKFALSLVEAAPHIKKASSELQNVKIEPMVDTAKGMSELAKAASEIPNEGGMFAGIAGDNSIADFALSLAEAAPNLLRASEKLKSMEVDSFSNTASALIEIAHAAAEIPNEGGMFAGIVGDNGISDFALSLAEAAPNLLRAGTAFASFNADTFGGISQSLIEIAHAASEIPNEGGMFAGIVGDNGIAKFTQELALAAPNISKFSSMTAGVNPDSVSNVVKLLTELANTIAHFPDDLDTGKLEQLIIGPALLSSISGIKDLGDIDDNSIEKSIEVLNCVLNLVSEEYPKKGLDVGYLATLANDLYAASQSLADCQVVLSEANLDPQQINSAIETLKLAMDSLTIAEIGGKGEGGTTKTKVDSDISEFTTKLYAAFQNLSDCGVVAEALVGENVANNISTAVGIIRDAGNAAKEIANEGGLVSCFTGENDIAVFANKLSAAFSMLSECGQTGATIVTNSESITSALNVFSNAAKVAKKMPNEGGLVSCFTGENDIAAFANKLNTAFSKLSECVTMASTIDINEIQAILSGLGNLTIPELSGFSSDVKSPNTNGLDKFVTALSSSFDKIEDCAISASTIDINEIQAILSGLGNLTIPELSGFSSGVSAIEEAIDSISSALNNAPTKINSAAGNFKTALESAGTNGVNAFVSKVESGLNKVKSSGGKLSTEYANGIKSKAQASTAAAKNVYNAAANAIKGSTSAFKSAGIAAGQGFVDGLRSKIPSASAAGAALGNAASAATNAALDVNSPSKVYMKTGAFVVEGFVEGIQNNFKDVRKTGVKLGNTILTSTNKALKINSPSKVMRDESGRYVVQGIAEGITADMSAEEAAKKKAENIKNAFQDVFDDLEIDTTLSKTMFDLWALENPRATAEETLTHNLEYLAVVLEKTKEETAAYEDQYNEMLKTLGEGHIETKKALNDWEQFKIKTIEAEKALQTAPVDAMTASIENLNKSLENSNTLYDVWSTRFGKSASPSEKSAARMKNIFEQNEIIKAELEQLKNKALLIYESNGNNPQDPDYKAAYDDYVSKLKDAEEIKNTLKENPMSNLKDFLDENAKELDLFDKRWESFIETKKESLAETDLAALETEKYRRLVEYLGKEEAAYADKLTETLAVYKENSAQVLEAAAEYEEARKKYTETLNSRNEADDSLDKIIKGDYERKRYEYNNYLKENRKNLLEAGFTYEQIIDLAKQVSGFDPSITLERAIKDTKNHAKEIADDGYILDVGVSQEGKTTIKKYKDSIRSEYQNMIDDELVPELPSPYKTAFDYGTDLSKGIQNGFTNSMGSYGNIIATKITNGVVEAVETIVDDCSAVIKEKEPEWYAIGVWLRNGLLNGISDDSLSATITPVIDFDGFTGKDYNNSIASIASLNPVNSRQLSSMIGLNRNNDTMYDDHNVIAAIDSLGDRVDSLGERVDNLSIVLDTGVLVGQITPRVDNQLGSRAALKERGV